MRSSSAGTGCLPPEPLKEKVLEVVALTGGAVTFKQTDRDVTLSLAREHQDPIVTLIKLTLDRAVSEIQSGPAVITHSGM